jgi:hypothetical protein
LERTWCWFYQDTTKIISRKKIIWYLKYYIMLSIYIGPFDLKTSYNSLLPWQHPCEVGENYCLCISSRNPRTRSKGPCSEPESCATMYILCGHPCHTLGALKRAHLSVIQQQSPLIQEYILYRYKTTHNNIIEQ